MPLPNPLAAGLNEALNHLLRQQPWARERLAPFAGETVELRGGLFPALRFKIDEQGFLQKPEAQVQPSLVVTLKPEAPAALARGEDHFLRAVEVSGDAKLADEVMALVRHLRWDFEEDLSRLVGDVAAHRLAEGLRGFAAWQADAVKRLGEAFAAYVTEEAKLVLQRADLDALARETAGLRDAIERLEQRIRRFG
jgi:ubiquinone biosynthesis protein UbiJ